MRNISQNKQFEIYDSIIREQLDSGIVKKIDKNCVCQGKEYYMPHKIVVRETAQTIKGQIVYDTPE